MVKSLRLGMRLRSQVCNTTVIVVRLPADEINVSCGGSPMIEVTADPTPGLALIDVAPNVLGKRYTLPTIRAWNFW